MKIKINWLIAIFVMMTSVCFSQTSVEKIFRKYKNDEDVVSLSFKGDLSNFLRNKAEVEFKSKIEACEFFMFDGKDNISKSDEAKIKEALNNDKYELLINVRNKTVKANVYAISKGEALSKVYAVASLDNKNIYLILAGNIFFEELSKMDFNIDGAKGLKDVFK
jgi:hypothetical protein